jgi:hypothetical protein
MLGQLTPAPANSLRNLLLATRGTSRRNCSIPLQHNKDQSYKLQKKKCMRMYTGIYLGSTSEYVYAL